MAESKLYPELEVSDLLRKAFSLARTIPPGEDREETLKGLRIQVREAGLDVSLFEGDSP